MTKVKILKHHEVYHPARLVRNVYRFGSSLSVNFHPAYHERYSKNTVYAFYDVNDAERFVKEVGADVAEIVKEK